MRKKIILLTSIICICIFANAQEDRLSRHLPADAGSIIHIDLIRLGAKLPAGMLQESNLYKKMSEGDGSSVLGTLIKNPAAGGIDLQPGVTIALKPLHSTMGNMPKYLVTVLLKLKDANAFTSIMTDKDNPLADSIRRYGTDRILYLDDKTTMGWNKQWLVLIAGAPQVIVDELTSYQQQHMVDTVTNYIDTFPVTSNAENSGPNFYELLQEKLHKAQRGICFDLLGGQSTNSFDSDTTYQLLMMTPGDIRIWSNASGSMSGLDSRFEKLLPMIDKLRSFTGSTRATWINFENGKVRSQSLAALSSTITSVYEKFPSVSQDFSMIKRLPPGKPLFLFNTTFNPAMQQELFSTTGMGELLRDVMEKLPVKLDLSPGTFGSTAMFAIIDPATAGSIELRKFEHTELIAALPIADKVRFEKLKTTVLEMIEKMRSESKGPKNMPVALYNDEMLVIARTREAATAFLAQLPTGPVPTWMSEKSTYPMVMNFQLHQFLNHLLGDPANEKTERAKPLIDAFNDIVMYGGKMENGRMMNTTELRFTNENENALTQLFSLTKYLNRDILRSGDEGEKNLDNDPPVPQVALDTVQSMSPIYPVPQFKNREVQDYVNSYADMVSEYVRVIETGATLDKLEPISLKSTELNTRINDIVKMLKDDPDEMQKLSSWMTKAAVVLNESFKKLDKPLTEPKKAPAKKKPATKKPVMGKTTSGRQ